MAQITLGGTPVHTYGDLPEIGSDAKDFNLVAADLSEKSLNDFAGKKLILNIFPSIDTGVCAASARRFNELASGLEDTVVLNISRDLPFALNRFCAAEGLQNVINLSDFRGDFGKIYGLEFTTGKLQGLLSRAVIVVDPSGKIIYNEQVPEIGQEPNYDAALEAIKA